jgi:hypothetical protein
VTYPGRAASGLRLAAEGDRPRAASACVAVVGRTGGRNTRWAWSHSGPAPRPEDAFRVGRHRSSVLSIPPFPFLSISLSVEAVLITCLK